MNMIEALSLDIGHDFFKMKKIHKYMDLKYFGSKIDPALSKSIYEAIKSNEKKDIDKVIENIIIIESYKYPEAYNMPINEMGKLIAKMTLKPSNEIMDKLIKHIDKNKAIKLIEKFKEENTRLENLIHYIHNLDAKYHQLNAEKAVDLELINLCRSIFGNENNWLVYKKYPKKLFFDVYWSKEYGIDGYDDYYRIIKLNLNYSHSWQN